MKAGEEVYFEHQMKKQILIQKKYATMEKAETERYLQLKEAYVCHIYFETIKIFRSCLCLSSYSDKIIIQRYRIRKN